MARQYLGELVAEAAGVFIIVVFGDSASAMYFLYDPSPYMHAYWGVAISWGLAVTIAIYVTASVTGAHVNPAVTLAFACFRDFEWKKVVPYWLAQTIGALVAAAIVYALFYPVIDHLLAAHHTVRSADTDIAQKTAAVFFTHPNTHITTMHAFMDEIILTALLVFGIFAITEQYNDMAPMANSGAFMIGLLVALIGASMGYLEAWAINPARDFGPRVFAWLAGWGYQAFPSPKDYWWGPIAGPLIGGVVGGAAYQWLIRPFLPARAGADPDDAE
ncbi:MIP/aquaporin family protein [Salinisphaera sp.]|uniref:MIP/aquaporin family protein n=1 Tax=Salinisphaera sp. TaxID=1914330 RepID=UPI002D77B49B|nr:MIP/aquaporin family protein [Salinisphaera sp.]HET7314849.1 MIP/aquaporin family protein [Salinisphaera sp.]